MEAYLNIFKALSDQTRLKMIWLLSNIDSKICVSEIMDVLGENHYNASRHLKILKNAGLIQEVKEGKWVFYHLIPPKDNFQELVCQTVKSIPKEFLTLEIEKCKKRLELREDGKCVIGLHSEKWNQTLNDLKNKASEE